jgi:hypothetical protein
MTKYLNLLLILLTSLTIYSQQHTFTSFSPTVAGKGETVTITGTNFTGVTGASSVKFGGTNATSVTVVNSTTIRAVVSTGTSGSITVDKSGFTNATRSGFIYREGITEIYGDFGGYWKSTVATVGTAIRPNSTNNMLAFKYGSTIYSTGVNDATLTSNGVSFTPGNFKGLPVTLSGSTCIETTTPYQYACNRNQGVTTGVGNPTLISTGSNLDGTTTSATYTHVNIKDLTIRSVLTDGANGLDISTGYTNLVINSVSTYDVKFIDSSGVVDNVPDIIITQTADPTGTTIDSYEFLDASGSRIGRAMNTLDLNTLDLLGNYNCDLYTVTPSTTFSTAKPNNSNTSNGSRPIRLVVFKLSDFGINSTNYNNVDKLKITASGKSDVSFIAYNANTIYSLPLVEINPLTDSVFCTGETNLLLKVDATLPGETMTYQWEMKVGSGPWENIIGQTGLSYYVSSPSLNTYRLKVTVVSSGYFVYSPTITLSGCLPVELISFNANCDESGINLEWKTVSEFNSDYFQIWKSESGNEWRIIEQQKAAGHSTELLSYNFTDKEISNSYYLLHQVDFDGFSKTYDPIYVNCDINNILLTKPNPSNNEFSLVLSSYKKEVSNIEIFNSFGNKILEKEVDLENGLNTILFNDKFDNGVYFIKVNNTVLKHIIW